MIAKEAYADGLLQKLGAQCSGVLADLVMELENFIVCDLIPVFDNFRSLDYFKCTRILV